MTRPSMDCLPCMTLVVVSEVTVFFVLPGVLRCYLFGAAA
jgi:hypothetical protein